MNTPLTPDQVAELQALLAQNNKIGAIKHYREFTGAGLAEAKQAIEQLEAGHPPISPAATRVLAANQLAVVHALLRRGKRIESIKAYRDFTGSELADANAAIEQLESKMSLSSPAPGLIPVRKSGCLGMILAVAVAVAGTLTALVLWLRHG